MSSRIQKQLLYFCNIIIPLLLGLLLYFYFRGDTFASQMLEKYLGITTQRRVLGEQWLPLVLRNYVADFLWAYALTFSVSCFLWDRKTWRFFSALLCGTFATAIEVSQKFGIIQGTFDIVDIFTEFAAIAIAILIINLFYKGIKKDEKSVKSN